MRDYGLNPKADLQLQYTLYKIIQADRLVLQASRDMYCTAQYGYPKKQCKWILVRFWIRTNLSDQDPDPYWFGSLDQYLHWDKKNWIRTRIEINSDTQTNPRQTIHRAEKSVYLFDRSNPFVDNF